MGSIGDAPPEGRNDEDSLPPSGASNKRAEHWAPHLARACRAAGQAPATAALERVLHHLREALGAERALLLEADPARAVPQVVAASSVRRDDPPGFSRSLLAGALRANRTLYFADVRREPGWADGSSLKSLALRSAIAAPLPSAHGARSAIVLDSRLPLTLDAAGGCALIGAFAGLVALIRRGLATEPVPRAESAAEIAGRSPALLRLETEIRSVARVPLPALVVGESGSGKELVARALHRQGSRSGGPFVAINCAAIPEALLERELFGATRGAFTGADRDHAGLFRRANGGTVFLDEIGDMPLSLQAKLLRVLQEGTVRAVGALEERAIDVRVIAATHRDLEALVDENRFRADLRWRLEVLVLRVPPLRDRAADLPDLSSRLIDRLAARCRLPAARLDADALERLALHGWPGNVRELESVLARALLRARDGVIRASDLDLAPEPPKSDAAGDSKAPLSLERAMIEEALREARGNLTAAALRIGWSRQALYRRLHALGLRDDRASSGGTRSSESSTFQ